MQQKKGNNNDYSYGAPPKVELFADHLEITSIGRIPEGLSKDDFFNGMSMPRNKELMRVFRDVEMVEALGSGMLRIMHTYGRENFEFGDNYIRFRVNYYDTVNDTENVLENVLEKDFQLTERQRNVIKRLCDTGQMNVIENDTVNDTVNDTENAESLSEYFNVSLTTIKRDMAKLQRLGLIRHDGPDKGGHWVVLKRP